jgi:antitoxin VapB
MLIAPIQHIEAIEMDEANRMLTAWEHKMGPCNRPIGTLVAHGMFVHGKITALVVTADLVAATCAGFTRSEAIELARLCASRTDLCRPMLRLWREFVFPCFGKPWAVSYQDEALHSGNVYRFDGWVQLRENCRSGTDARSGRKGRSKTVWGWHADPAVRASTPGAPR